MKPLLLMLIPPVFMQAAAMFTPPPAPPATIPNDDQSELVAGNNAFAIELYALLRQRAGNLFFSPASISTALAMTFAGASGSTANEMQHALHFTLPPARLHPAMGALLGHLNAAHTGYQLRVANALWAQQDETFLPAYLALTGASYAAGFHPVDFVKDPEKVRLAINQWIDQQTADKIKDLLKPGVVTAATRLVLTNAIYFKGDWQAQFDKTQTKDEDFHLSTQQTVRAPLMHRQANLNYFNGGTFQVIELPYKGAELSIVVFLPNDPDGLPAFEKALTPADLHKWLSLLQPASKVILTLPKFKMTQQFELNDALSALGIKQAFVQGSADFSAMTGKRDLFISTAIHKACIDVNEEGTEAAAATSTVMRTLSMRREPQPIVFRADHPFLFLIRDNRSGAFLFVGRIENPSK